MLLDGNWTDLDAVIEVHDPQDGRLVGTVPRAGAEQMREAISAAVAASAAARRQPTHERMAILQGAAAAIEQRHEHYARTIASEGVKTIREARKEVAMCCYVALVGGGSTPARRRDAGL